MVEFGGICLWLIMVLNIITGNLDEVGGMMFPRKPSTPYLPPARAMTVTDRVSAKDPNLVVNFQWRFLAMKSSLPEKVSSRH